MTHVPNSTINFQYPGSGSYLRQEFLYLESGISSVFTKSYSSGSFTTVNSVRVFYPNGESYVFSETTGGSSGGSFMDRQIALFDNGVSITGSTGANSPGYKFWNLDNPSGKLLSSENFAPGSEIPVDFGIGASSGLLVGYKLNSSTGLRDVYLSGSPVPEPASIAVLGLGALALLRRRKTSQSQI